MSTRVNANDVKLIFETDLTDEQLTAFIRMANVYINSKIDITVLGSDLLIEIERNLAAHFASMRDQRVQSESIGGEYSATYQGQTGMNILSTYYGQTAAQLDTTGELITGALKPARFTVFNTPKVGTDL